MVLRKSTDVYTVITLNKQCRPRSDAAECGVRSGSTMFATHPVLRILDTSTCSEMDLKDNYGKELTCLYTQGIYGTHIWNHDWQNGTLSQAPDIRGYFLKHNIWTLSCFSTKENLCLWMCGYPLDVLWWDISIYLQFILFYFIIFIFINLFIYFYFFFIYFFFFLVVVGQNIKNKKCVYLLAYKKRSCQFLEKECTQVLVTCLED